MIYHGFVVVCPARLRWVSGEGLSLNRCAFPPPPHHYQHYHNHHHHHLHYHHWESDIITTNISSHITIDVLLLFSITSFSCWGNLSSPASSFFSFYHHYYYYYHHYYVHCTTTSRGEWVREEGLSLKCLVIVYRPFFLHTMAPSSSSLTWSSSMIINDDYHQKLHQNQMLWQRVFHPPSLSTTQNVSVNMNKVDIKQTLIQTRLKAQLMQKCRKITCAVFQIRWTYLWTVRSDEDTMMARNASKYWLHSLASAWWAAKVQNEAKWWEVRGFCWRRRYTIHAVMLYVDVDVLLLKVQMYVISTDCIKAAVIIVHVCMCEVYWKNWQQCWWKCLCVFGKNVKWLQNMTGGDVGPRVGERWQFALMISSVSRVDIFCASSCGSTSTSQQCLNDYVWTIIEQWHLSALQLSASSETSERHSTFPNALQCCKVAFCNVDREAKEAHSGVTVDPHWGANSDFFFKNLVTLHLWYSGWNRKHYKAQLLVGRYKRVQCKSGVRRWITENCGGLLLLEGRGPPYHHHPPPPSPVSRQTWYLSLAALAVLV